MRTLYFDINGTLVRTSGAPKSALTAGKFEAAVRASGFEQLVCVSSLVRVVKTLHVAGRLDDPLVALRESCGGAFADDAWYREHVVLGEHCHQRVRCIELNRDWWYVDDDARLYCEDAGRDDLFRIHSGKRIFSPAPNGDGDDVIAWLRAIKAPDGAL